MCIIKKRNMSASKPFENGKLENCSQILNNNGVISSRSAPVLPPRLANSSLGLASGYNSLNSYSPYSGVGYGGYNAYSSYGLPYRNSMYSSYGSNFSGYNYGSYGGYPSYAQDDHERRFIQYAEERSRSTFANVESIVRAVNSLAMMLDNTFFAMTSSFRAVLSVAENFGRLRSMFSHIWYSINIFRFINWLYRQFFHLLGYKVPRSSSSVAWKQATEGAALPSTGNSSGWSTLAFLGMLISAPYIISKFLPKFEDKGDPTNWKSPGIRAKAVFDFVATSPNEVTVLTNDFVLLAPTYIQEEMRLKNTGWAFAVCKGKSGVVPLNYLAITKGRAMANNKTMEVPVPKANGTGKSSTKRVSFGENQVFENIDIDDYVPKENANKSSQETDKVEKIESKEKFDSTLKKNESNLE